MLFESSSEQLNNNKTNKLECVVENKKQVIYIFSLSNKKKTLLFLQKINKINVWIACKNMYCNLNSKEWKIFDCCDSFHMAAILSPKIFLKFRFLFCVILLNNLQNNTSQLSLTLYRKFKPPIYIKFLNSCLKQTWNLRVP